MREWTLRVASGETRILLERGGLRDLSRLLVDSGHPLPEIIVSNTTVAPLYAGPAASGLGLDSPIELPDGESFKNWESIELLSMEFLHRDLHRGSSLLALGGGVITDLTGFAASIFMRGVPWVAVPTTLLAMVDASIGGKTGINLPEGKNLLGSFWPPALVIVDPGTLETLPEREFRSGIAEVLKAGWISDHRLISLCADEGTDRIDELISRAIEVKVGIVQADEREAGVRKALNLGHTLGHALESVGAYRRLLHGEAVAWGMRFVLEISRKRGLLSSEAYRMRLNSLRSLGPLPPISDFDTEAIIEVLARDKKRDTEGVEWVLPDENGVLLDQRIESEEIRGFFSGLKA